MEMKFAMTKSKVVARPIKTELWIAWSRPELIIIVSYDKMMNDDTNL